MVLRALTTKFTERDIDRIAKAIEKGAAVSASEFIRGAVQDRLKELNAQDMAEDCGKSESALG